MAEYITLPVEIDPDVLRQSAYDRLQAAYAGWQPGEGNLEVLIIEELAQWAADNRFQLTVATDEIFEYLGESIYNIPKAEAVSATVNVTVTASDILGHTIAAGDEFGIENDDGDTVGFVVVDDVVINPGSSTTGTGAVTLEAIEPGVDGNGLSGTATPLEDVSWIATVTLVGSTVGGEDAQTSEEYRNDLVNEIALFAPRPVKAEDFARYAALKIDGVFRALGIDNYNPKHNLLSANAASMETSVADWTATPTNCVVTQQTTYAVDNSNSARMRSVAAGDMIAHTPTGASATSCKGSQKYTARVQLRAGANARACSVGMAFYDAANAQIGAITYGSDINDATANFNTEAKVTVTSPDNAVRMAIYVRVKATGAANEDHYFDVAMIREGATSTPWVPGGTPAEGNAATVTVAVMAEDGSDVPTLVSDEVKATLQALREEGFVVNVIGSTPTQISVAYQITTLPDFDDDETLDAVDAVLDEYFSPEVWARPISGENDAWELRDTVRLFEVATLINNTAGVDNLIEGTLLINGVAGNLKISGPAPTTTPGTFTGTVV